MELFISYGESYFAEDKYAGVPRSSHFWMGDRLLQSFDAVISKVQNQQRKNESRPSLVSSSNPSWMEDLYDLSVHSFHDIWDSTVVKTLPDEFDRVEEIMRKGVRQSHVHKSIRSIEWLKENGSCSDNLEPGTSSIPYAGQGAFARRPIVKGQTIAPAPLIHIPDRKSLNMYQPLSGQNYLYSEGGRDPRNVTEPPYHRQLLLNYCYGHSDIDLLLCPYGVGTALINHSRERANAQIIWSKKLMSHPEWLEKNPREWDNLEISGLAWEFVATRDIGPGEEVFLDYGEEWEQAWLQHVANWSVPTSSCIPASAFELNKHKPHLLLPTIWERREDFSLLNHDFCESSRNPNHHFPDFQCDVDLLLEMGFLRNGFRSGTEQLFCRPVHRYQNSIGDIEYTVEVVSRYDPEVEGDQDQEFDDEEDVTGDFFGDDDDDDDDDFFDDDDDDNEFLHSCTERHKTVLFGTSGDVFYFVDRPYTRDSAQPWSFRHEMQIPDILIPQVWKKNHVEESNVHFQSGY